jgi:undecaprenyl-diphosphatase
MTIDDARMVLAAYAWAGGSPLLTRLDVILAEGGIVLLPATLFLLWIWPGASLESRREAVATCAISAMLAVMMILALGQFVDRPRPFVELHLVPLFPHVADSSFPSDHTLASVAMVGPLVGRRGGRGLGLGLVAWSLLIGAARVAAAVHYPSDIIVSATIALVASGAALLVRPAVPPLDWPANWPVRRSR